MKKISLSGLFLLFAYTLTAQLNENFSDGDFTTNPSWNGSTTSWIVNSNLQLQSGNTTANSTFYLSTSGTMAMQTQWEFYAELGFNPSSANYADVMLTASAADISAASTTGYFVRIGNSDDEISLYRKDATGSVKLIDGINGILNSSSNRMRIKVTRNATGQWQLLRDLSATGNNYFAEGTSTDITYISSSFFGILVKQSTAGFFEKHFFDDLLIQTYVPDVTPPVLVAADAASSTTVDLLFNEAIDATSAQSVSNYFVDHGIGLPQTAARDNSNAALLHLVFAQPFPAGVSCTMNINGVKDISGNVLNNGTAVFSFYNAGRYDIIIDELMADPSPAVGLPEQEWLELKNVAAFPINLQGWKVCDATGCSAAMPAISLKPDSFLIVCSNSALPFLQTWGRTIGITGFPSLDNTGESLRIINAAGQLIHTVSYTDNWYRNELKKEGGWSLEMIDTHNPCTGSDNWTASTSVTGATPGKKNTADSINNDESVPALLRAFATDSLHINLVFDEPLDSTKAAVVSNYTISNGIGQPQSCIVALPGFQTVHLLLKAPLLRNTIYEITVSQLTDCSGNVIGEQNKARVGLAEDADSLDAVINEILFNPSPGAVDYVELYNRGTKIIDLASLYIANRNSQGLVSSIAAISEDHYLFFPGDFMVVCSDPALVKQYYITINPSAFMQLRSMPSYNDDEGDAILLNQQGEILDELRYTEKWHFKLINDPEGVALERIDPDLSTQTESNWHSAATHVGYGTPGYKNSQYRVNEEAQGTVTTAPGIISPDNDGRDDFATISYQFPSPGYVANITIFDAAGLPVRYLQRNALCGISGYFRWDGLGENNQRLLPGIYIVLTEVFNLEGKKKKIKNVIVIAGK